MDLINRKIISYVSSLRKKNFSEDQIRMKLRDSNYPEKIIDKIFNHIKFLHKINKALLIIGLVAIVVVIGLLLNKYFSDKINITREDLLKEKNLKDYETMLTACKAWSDESSSCFPKIIQLISISDETKTTVVSNFCMSLSSTSQQEECFWKIGEYIGKDEEKEALRLIKNIKMDSNKTYNRIFYTGFGNGILGMNNLNLFEAYRTCAFLPLDVVMYCVEGISIDVNNVDSKKCDVLPEETQQDCIKGLGNSLPFVFTSAESISKCESVDNKFIESCFRGLNRGLSVVHRDNYIMYTDECSKFPQEFLWLCGDVSS